MSHDKLDGTPCTGEGTPKRRLVFKCRRNDDGSVGILALAGINLCGPEEFFVVFSLLDDDELKALKAEVARKAFEAGRRDKQGCVVNIDYGDKGLGNFEYLRVDDYLRAEGLK